MATFYQFFLAILISFAQVVFVLSKGYFLSLEFTLYPYLISHGFVPYKNLLDQHFPSLFFGAFSLPLLSSTNPTPLLLLFLSLLFFTNLLFYRYLKIKKTQHPLLWLLLFVIVMAYFSVNILWVETFINFLLVIFLNLSLAQTKFSKFLMGLILSQILLLRPTLAPCLIALIFLYKTLNLELTLGFITGIFVSFGYLLFQNNFTDFIQLAIVFNSSTYAKASVLFPTTRQLFFVGLLLGLSFLNTLRSQKWLAFLVICLSLLASFPRFGLEHLQPFVLLVVLTLSQSYHFSKWLLYLVIMLFSAQILFGLRLHRYGNYFWQPHLYPLAQKLTNLPGPEIYLFGASDLLYPLSNKLPPGKLYLPSLPWYLNYPPYQTALLSSLKSSPAPVLVDTNFSVDGQKLINSSPQIYEYIKMNYNLVETEGSFELYIKNQ